MYNSQNSPHVLFMLFWIYEFRLIMGYFHLVNGFYMKGELLGWYKWIFQNHQLFSHWYAFSKALKLCFGPSTYENHQTQLFKLRQHGFVSKYQVDFEKLANRVIGLPSKEMLNCFILGLISEIHNELAI